MNDIMRICLLMMIIYWPAFSSAASFDCSKANKLVEMIICEAEEISRLDEEMANIYFSIKKTLILDEKTYFTDSQRKFLRRRNKCHEDPNKLTTIHTVFKVRDCLENIYSSRIEELRQVNNYSYKNDRATQKTSSAVEESKCPRIAEANFVFIPAGSFYMGKSNGAYSDERPRHKVDVGGFCISKLPVGNEWISFNQAVKYTNDLSRKHGVRIRMLTESEWEYVASMGIENNRYGIDKLMDDWELTSSIYSSYPYRQNDGREDLSAKDAHRVLRGGQPGDPSSGYVPTISLRGYASPNSPYRLRLAADIQK